MTRYRVTPPPTGACCINVLHRPERNVWSLTSRLLTSAWMMSWGLVTVITYTG